MGNKKCTKTGNKAKLLILLLLMPLIAGCWDRSELDERALVLGISIDKADPETEKEEPDVSHLPGQEPLPAKDMIRLTAQLAVPGRIPLGPGGQGGGASPGGSQTIWPLSVVGHSMSDAIANLQQQISSPLFLGHLRTIVVSEEIARKELKDINDYFRRNPEVRRTTWMMVSSGKAEPLMRSAPEIERVPTLYLMMTLEQAVKLGKFPQDFIGVFWSRSVKKGQEGFLPYVEVQKKDNILIQGMAYFKGTKMVGKPSPLEIAAYMGIKGESPGGYQLVKIPGTKSQAVFAATQRKSKIDFKIVHGRPDFSVKVWIEGNINEINADAHLNDDNIKDIERAEAKRVQKIYGDLVSNTQKDGSDIFGFGEYVRAKAPKYWNREIRTVEQWQNMYKDVSVHIQTMVRVRRVGMTTS
ncbi:spore gernimation protein GerC [Cohnella kolymensis]|uniref:Spore gernimation protein GerC n=1 Tax=Cohnella kolymensis TaxID=1590652 RepID=A0ABR5A8H1_9BACL|nr:Ger(x)C family spore germination protein [Cohnella kolymensis]KIL37346.1 spore gernimation protein GerC [Cohnella kolymensis]